ncbi:zinc finger MYM-type protein 1 [Tanacetum coccineum]
MAQMKKLTFEELKVEFEKLMRSIESFVPMGSGERVKRAGVQLEQESSKKQNIVVEDVLVTEEKVEVVKKEEPIKRTGKRKKQKARKGTHADKTAKHEAEEDMEALVKGNDTDSSSCTDIPVSAVPVAIKPPSIANWKIIKLGNKGVYQIIREDGTYITYINFGAMLKSIPRDDLTKLYRLVMQKYGTNGPEDEYERVFWGDLKTMFDPPLSTDPVWNLPYQQKMLRWRYYDTCRVHCLTLESADIYMLTERRYPIPADVCQAMLDKKLQGDKKDEACYQFCNGVEKDCLSVGLATTQQMVISSPCLTDIKNWLVQSKRLWGGLLGIKYSRLNSVSNTVSSASTHVSTGRRVSIVSTVFNQCFIIVALDLSKVTNLCKLKVQDLFSKGSNNVDVNETDDVDFNKDHAEKVSENLPKVNYNIFDVRLWDGLRSNMKDELLFKIAISKSELSNVGTNDWKHLSIALKNHENSSEHMINFRTWSELRIRESGLDNAISEAKQIAVTIDIETEFTIKHAPYRKKQFDEIPNTEREQQSAKEQFRTDYFLVLVDMTLNALTNDEDCDIDGKDLFIELQILQEMLPNGAYDGEKPWSSIKIMEFTKKMDMFYLHTRFC